MTTKSAPFTRTKAYESELNKCIRCGYCYELCPLFKSTAWESDTPRGKLLLLYGIISGDLKPSQDIADKIFECFYCKNCTDNCSAGVPITDILTDARADFLDAGFDVTGTIVHVDDELCSRCGICVSVCKYDALTFENRGTQAHPQLEVAVDKIECRGCGLCVAACPSGAISQQEGCDVTLAELHAKVKNLLENKDMKLIVFVCNWALFPGLQLSQSPTLVSTPYGVIVSMCSGRVTPELVLNALEEGAWGVMVAGCPPEECDHDGNYKARRRLILLQKMLKDLNIEPERIRLEWFSSGEGAQLERAIHHFEETLQQLGPIPIVH